jgi:hypothetical protein
VTDPDPALPEQTSDDTDMGWGDAATADEDDDARLLGERPPHHLDRD